MIEIVERATGEVVDQMEERGGERATDRLIRGIEINLDHDRFYVRRSD